MPRPTAQRLPIWLSCLLLAALLSGCATAPGRTSSDDPWQGTNRSIYKFNDALDRAAVKPAAKVYQKITPQWLRTGISNFFSNLGTPWVAANDLLQGKPQLMAQDTCRFVFNTIVGLGGFIDVAGKLELGAHNEDFGQTLAVWGVPSGPYLMLPLLGPSTLRDSIGKVPDYFGRPTQYTDISWQTSAGLSALEVIQVRARLLTAEDTLNNAYDKYGVLRDAWLQRREYLIYDGNPPPEAALEDDSEAVSEDDAKDSSAPAAP